MLIIAAEIGYEAVYSNGFGGTQNDIGSLEGFYY